MNTTYGVLNNSSLIVDTDKLRENVRTILRSLPAGTKLIPVVKDDAYGMGMGRRRADAQRLSGDRLLCRRQRLRGRACTDCP